MDNTDDSIHLKATKLSMLKEGAGHWLKTSDIVTLDNIREPDPRKFLFSFSRDPKFADGVQPACVEECSNVQWGMAAVCVFGWPVWAGGQCVSAHLSGTAGMLTEFVGIPQTSGFSPKGVMPMVGFYYIILILWRILKQFQGIQF